jgi:glycosyltransferase involved in cell wall biosynthesis
MLKSETHQPLFTVIIPTYNRAHLLSRAIKSVLNQTYRNFELIIVNDGSTDNTEDVCRSFSDHRIKYHKQTPTRGMLAATNKALLEQFGEEQRSLCSRAYGRRLATLGAYHIMNGEKAAGRKACRESFKYYKWPGFAGIYLLSFILSGRQIRGLARPGSQGYGEVRCPALLAH